MRAQVLATERLLQVLVCGRCERDEGAGARPAGLWRAQTRTLERAEALLEKAEELPVVKLVAEPAERLVAKRLDLVTAVPVEGYAELNARNAVKALADLDRVGLLCVQRWENANKARKTVLDSITKRLS